LGLDFDSVKIELANNCISKHDRISFVAADALGFDYPAADIFLLSDVLHYIPREKQSELLSGCIQRLNPGENYYTDADKDLQARHLGTRMTEFFSTNFGYNKSLNKRLFFFQGIS
jgi:O-methyltransferase involved in polyketide biosynthesis